MGLRAHLITKFKEDESFSMGDSLFCQLLLEQGLYGSLNEDGVGLILISPEGADNIQMELVKIHRWTNEVSEAYRDLEQVRKDIVESKLKTGVSIARYYIF